MKLGKIKNLVETPAKRKGDQPDKRSASGAKHRERFFCSFFFQTKIFRVFFRSLNKKENEKMKNISITARWNTCDNELVIPLKKEKDLDKIFELLIIWQLDAVTIKKYQNFGFQNQPKSVFISNLGDRLINVTTFYKNYYSEYILNGQIRNRGEFIKKVDGHFKKNVKKL